MKVFDWFRPPRSVLTLYLVGAGAALGCLAWLAAGQLKSDELADAQRTQQRLAGIAEAVAARVRLGLGDAQRALSDDTETLAEGAAVVQTAGERTRVVRGSLPFLPDSPASTAGDPDALASVEALEFASRDLIRAAAAYREMATAASSRVVSAKALVGLGRVLRGSGRHAQALAAYDRLDTMPDIVIEGRPADLIARIGRCSALKESGETEQLRREARRLRADLAAGRWPVSGAVWQAMFDEATGWAGPDAPAIDGIGHRLVLADAFAKHMDMRRDGAVAGPSVISANAGAAVIIPAAGAHTASVLVLGSNWLTSLWSQVAADAGVNVALVDRDDRVVLGHKGDEGVRLGGGDTGSPWTIVVADANPALARASRAAGRRTLLLGLAIVCLLIAGSGYFTFRGIRRELAIARVHAEFVSAASHELRTPLTSIRQLAHLLRTGRVESDDRRNQYYGVIVRESERLHRLVDRLLKFGRVDSGRFQLESVDARELAQHVAEDFRQTTGDRVLEISTPDTPCPLRADRELLTLAVWNLLENAVKYSPEGGSVRLDIRASNGRVRMAVTDSGIGIPAQDQRRIFEQFVRGSSAGTSAASGSGLGLALVDRVVRAHGGDVELVSEPGRGSVFTIVLPMETAA